MTDLDQDLHDRRHSNGADTPMSVSRVGVVLHGDITDTFEACDRCGASWARLDKSGTPLFRVDPGANDEIQFVCEQCR